VTTPQRLRILLVEDDAIFAAVTAEVMRERALVRWTPTAESALAAAGEKDWDLIITDIELPGMSGLELVMKIKAAQPHVATLILTGHRSFDNAVEAIRVGADDFLTKPVDRATLIAKIDELAALSARRKASSSASVLAIGAHPDDIEVGCGGILLNHVAQGHEVAVLVLTGGDVSGMPAERAREASRAAELMSVRLFHANVAEASVAMGSATINEITRVIDEVNPDTVYTHSEHDFNQDHRNTHQATLAAARSVPGSSATRAPRAPSTSTPTVSYRSTSSWTASSQSFVPTPRRSASAAISTPSCYSPRAATGAATANPASSNRSRWCARPCPRVPRTAPTKPASISRRRSTSKRSTPSSLASGR